MTNPQDEKLRSLYRQRKQGIETPVAIRHSALKRAKTQAPESAKIWWNFGRQLSLASGLACLVVLGLFINHTLSGNHRSQQAETFVEITQIKSEPKSIRESLNEDYRHATINLAQRQLTAAIHHKQVAQLAFADGRWEVKMCNNNLLSISPQLLAQLAENNALALDAQQGDFVELAFSNTGHLISIAKPTIQVHC